MMKKLTLLTFLVLLIAPGLRAQPWTRITTLPQRNFYSLEIFGNTMYAGATDTLFISNDKGATWTKRKVPGSGNAITAITIFNGRLYAGTQDGPMLSTDGGLNWVPGNFVAPISSFASWNGSLYASTAGGGIIVSGATGNTWTPFNQNYPVALAGYVLRILNTGKSLFAIGGSNGSCFRYDSTAKQWNEQFYAGGPVPGLSAFDIMQGVEGHLFVLNDGFKMLRSNDTGANWYLDSLDLRYGTDGVMRRASQNYYIAMNGNAGGAWLQQRSVHSPGGLSWAGGEEFFAGVRIFAIREYDRRLFLARNDGVWFKTNGSAPAGLSAGGEAVEALLYPNPARVGDAVTISSDGLDHIEIFDMAGRLIHAASKPTGTYQVRMAQAGSYVLRVHRDSQTSSQLLIVR